jgi:hypothetical protein
MKRFIGTHVASRTCGRSSEEYAFESTAGGFAFFVETFWFKAAAHTREVSLAQVA